MDKDKLALILDQGPVKPADRRTIGRNQVFVADGFVPPPHHYLERFGVREGQYPNGVYMTIWWTDQKPQRGGAAFFEPDHDPLLMLSYKKKARINSVLKAAAYDLRKMDALH